jgi:DNA-directed RNA polymerase specialized sigma subunit
MFSAQNKLEPEFTDAYNAWKTTPSPASNSGLLKAVTPVIDTALRSYGDASPTLRSRAKQLTLKALPAYDPGKGTLRTHLLSQLQSLRRLSTQQQQIISLPEQVGLDQKYLYDTESRLRDENGFDPSDADIADATGISLKRLKYVRQFRAPLAESAVNSSFDSGDEPHDPATQTAGKDNHYEAWLDFVYADLGQTDRVIMDYTLGRNGTPKLPLQDVARRLGITPSAASQRAAKIQRMIDERQSLSIL